MWASGLVFCLIWANQALAFNLETSLPIIKQGRETAYFGYSVAQHRTLRNPDYGESGVILVGAPRDQNLQPNTSRSGALWSCPLSSSWQVRHNICSSRKKFIEPVCLL